MCQLNSKKSPIHRKIIHINNKQGEYGQQQNMTNFVSTNQIKQVQGAQGTQGTLYERITLDQPAIVQTGLSRRNRTKFVTADNYDPSSSNIEI